MTGTIIMAPLNPPKSPSSMKNVYFERVNLYLVSERDMVKLAVGNSLLLPGKYTGFVL